MNQFQGQYQIPGMNPPSQNNGQIPPGFQGDHQSNLSNSFSQMNIQNNPPQQQSMNPPQSHVNQQYQPNLSYPNMQQNKPNSGAPINNSPAFQGMPSNPQFLTSPIASFIGSHQPGNNMMGNDYRQSSTGSEIHNFDNQLQQDLNNGPPNFTQSPPSNAKPVLPLQPKPGVPILPPGSQNMLSHMPKPMQPPTGMPNIQGLQQPMNMPGSKPFENQPNIGIQGNTQMNPPSFGNPLQMIPPSMNNQPNMNSQASLGNMPNINSQPSMKNSPGMPLMGAPPGMPGPQLNQQMNMQPPSLAPQGMFGSQSMGIPGQPSMGPPMGMPGMAQPGMPNMPGMPQPGIQTQPGMNLPGMPGMPGMPGPPGMMDGMQQKQQRLDPEQMPSAVQVREDDKIAKSGLFPTGYPTAEVPPLVTTDYIAQDQGNSSPRFLRSSIYAVPTTNDALKISKLPFVVSCTPFGKTADNEYVPPIVNLGDLGPVRCQRCKAYMCPFMQFIDGGRKFKCPFCDAATPVVDEYFAHLDHTGRRTDISHRPEFCLGSYEFVANTAYCKNKVLPKEPAFIFMLDVSYNAIKSGLVTSFCLNFKNLLSKLPKETYQEKSTLRVGFVTYDHTLHFYNLSSKSKKPEMTIVSDIEDVFVPFVDGFLVDASEAEESIQKILDEIPRLFGNTRITDTCLGPVVQAGLDALKSSDRAGKVFIFHTSLPVMEAPGKLTNRDDRKVLGGEKEKTVLAPNGEFYTKLGEECTKNGVCVDLFLFPNAYIDVASLTPLVSLSGGHLYKYQYFDAAKDGENFLVDLEHAISRETAFDAIMRIRTSTGLRAVNFYGHFLMQNSTDMEFGAIDSDKSVLAEIKYDDKLPPNEPCYIQAATLYTSVSGQRRLRIHNLSLATTTDFSTIYKAIEADTFVAYLYKHAERIVREKLPKDMKEQIINMCAHILATYRDKCSDNPPIGQLILPECLRLLPLYLGSILKNDGVTGGADLTVDNRAFLMQLIPGLKTEDIIRILYPKVIPVSGVVVENDADEFFMPQEVRASYEYLKPTEAYLIESGVQVFLWIGQQVSTDWIQAIFNVQGLQHIDTESHVIPERDNAQSRGLRKVIKIVTKDIIRHTKITIIRQTDPLEAWMKRFLVEDRFAGQGGSYVDSLCALHREIRTILS
uniref:Protein transport protein Sec24C n=1 Tax=Parastrongyloides trichosuri TaxID=131310 RepID=A0A0N4ZBP9_PARTI